jgi:N-acetyl-alpha-D-muramate 1-phosphate uridylyltransferase
MTQDPSPKATTTSDPSLKATSVADRAPWTPRVAMILGAGLGTRMRPYTDTLPKPMVPLKGRPLIDHVMDRITAEGIPRVVVNVHHCADRLEQHLLRRSAPTIQISDERALLLDTGGGLKHALPLLGDQPFLVHNSDSVWIEGAGRNLRRLCDAWDDGRMDFLLMLALGAASLGYDGRGDFSCDPEGRLRRRRESEVVPFVFTGVSIVHPRVFADAPEGVFSMTPLWNRAILAGRAFGVRMDGLWMHVGTPEALIEAEQAMDRYHA